MDKAASMVHVNIAPGAKDVMGSNGVLNATHNTDCILIHKLHVMERIILINALKHLHRTALAQVERLSALYQRFGPR